MSRIGLLALLIATGMRAAGPATAPLETVPILDLARYQGRWYEIARKPNRFQKDCAGNVVVEYQLRDDGRVEVVNQCAGADGRMDSAIGIARRPEPVKAPAKLEVRFAPAILGFLPFVWGDYWVIDLDPEYRWAVVGEPGRNYFWVLSRGQSLPEATLLDIIRRAEGKGYDLSDLIRTSHTK